MMGGRIFTSVKRLKNLWAARFTVKCWTGLDWRERLKGRRQAMQIKIGDTIGLINKVKFNMRDNRENYWDLTEGKVKSITINSKGRRVKAEHYYTMDAYDIETNTQWMLESDRLILTGEPFVLTDELRKRVERWIERENEAD
jgi:hypothetical protein